jgi:hypothetical protein
MQGKSSDAVCRLCCFTYCYRLVFSFFYYFHSFDLSCFVAFFSWCFLTILNLGMLFYVFLFAALQDNHHQSAWGQSFAIWLVLEIIFVSTVLCFLFHILLPSFLFRNVYQVKRKLIESITKYQESLASSGSAMSAQKEGKENEREQDTDEEEEEEGEDGDLSKEAKKTKSTAVKPLHSSTLLSVSPRREEVLPFNAAKYLFLSYRLASLYSETKVGKILLSFSSPWPRQSYYYINDISKKYNKRFSAFIRSGTLVLVFLLTNFLTIPLSFQDLLLSFFTTTGIGYYLYLHLLLYDIHPSLIVLPDLLLLFVVFLLFKVFVYFVLPSEKEKELVKHLAAATTTTSSSSSIATLASNRRFSAVHSLRSTSDHCLERNGRESHKRRRISSAFSVKSSVVQPVDDKEEQQQQQQKHISRRLSIQNGIVLLTDMEKAAVAKEKEEEKAEKKEMCNLDAVLKDSTEEDMIITSELVEQQVTEVTANTSSFLSVFAIRNESDQVTKKEKHSDPLYTNEMTNICKSDKRSSAVKVNLIREMSKKRVNSWFDVVGLNVSAEPPTPAAVKESKKSDASESNESMKIVDAGSAAKENLVAAIPEKKLEEKQGGKSRDELQRARKKEKEETSTTQKIPFAEGKEWKILHNDEDEKYQHKQVREKEPYVLMVEASEATIAESKDSSVNHIMSDEGSNLSFNHKQKQEESKPLVDNIVDDLAVFASDDVNDYDDGDVDDDNDGDHSSVVFSSEHDEPATGEVVTDVEQALWENEERQDDNVYKSNDKSSDEGDNNDQFQPVHHEEEEEEERNRDDDDDIILEVHHYPSSVEIADLPIHSYNNHENDLDDGSSSSPYVVLQNNKLFILPPSPQRASSFQLPRGQSFMIQQPQPFHQQVLQQQHYFQLEQQFQQPSTSHIAPAMVVLPRKSMKIRRRTTRKSGKSRLSTLKKSEKLSSPSSFNVTASIKEVGGAWGDEDDAGSLNFSDFDDGETNDLSFILDSPSDDLKESGDM